MGDHIRKSGQCNVSYVDTEIKCSEYHDRQQEIRIGGWVKALVLLFRGEKYSHEDPLYEHVDVSNVLEKIAVRVLERTRGKTRSILDNKKEARFEQAVDIREFLYGTRNGLNSFNEDGLAFKDHPRPGSFSKGQLLKLADAF